MDLNYSFDIMIMMLHLKVMTRISNIGCVYRMEVMTEIKKELKPPINKMVEPCYCPILANTHTNRWSDPRADRAPHDNQVDYVRRRKVISEPIVSEITLLQRT